MSITGDRTTAPWLDDSLYPFVSKYLQADGGRMHYIDEGQGEPIIFVHGFPTWSFMWRGLVRDLSVKHRCIAMDHIGFGLSDKPAHWSYTPEAHARNFRKLVEHLNLSTFSLVVHDIGGPIALSYALDNPGRINRICVINSFLWSLKTDPHFQRFDHRVHGPWGAFAMTATNTGLARMIRNMVVQKQKVAAKVYGQYTGPFTKAAERHGPHGLAKAYIGSCSWYYDLWARREAIAGKPIQVLWGMKDKLFSNDQLTKWRTTWPHADVVTFPESGHLVTEEQGREVEAAVYMFLDGHKELTNTSSAIFTDFN